VLLLPRGRQGRRLVGSAVVAASLKLRGPPIGTKPASKASKASNAGKPRAARLSVLLLPRGRQGRRLVGSAVVAASLKLRGPPIGTKPASKASKASNAGKPGRRCGGCCRAGAKGGAS